MTLTSRPSSVAVADASTDRADRFTRAESIVRRYCAIHIAFDVGTGAAAAIVGTPGAGTAAIMASIAVQAPLIYQPMVRELSRLYDADAAVLRRMGRNVAIVGGFADVGAEFGIEFLKETASELLSDYAVGLSAGAIPVAGGLAAAVLDAYLAYRLTRLVAILALTYLENGCRWPGDRLSTRHFVRILLGQKLTLRQSVERIVGPESDERLVDAATLADGLLIGADLGDSANEIDQHVLDAIERWRHADPHQIDSLVSAFTSKSGVYADPGFLDSLKGFVGEDISAEQTGGTLSAATNEKAVDMLWDGQMWQIKTGSTAYEHAMDALQQDPSMPIISDAHTAQELGAQGYEAVGIGALDNEHLERLVNGAAVGIEHLDNIGLEIPVLSMLVIGYVELKKLREGKQDVGQTVAAVTVRVGSRSVAIFALSVLAVMGLTAAGLLAGGGPVLAGTVVVAAMAGAPISEQVIRLRLTQEVAQTIERTWQKLRTKTPDPATVSNVVERTIGAGAQAAARAIGQLVVMRVVDTRRQAFFERYFPEKVLELKTLQDQLRAQRNGSSLLNASAIVSVTAASLPVIASMELAYRKAYAAAHRALIRSLERGAHYEQICKSLEQLHSLDREIRTVAAATRAQGVSQPVNLLGKLKVGIDTATQVSKATSALREKRARARRELKAIRRGIRQEANQRMKETIPVPPAELLSPGAE